jgi:GNAT superfamily N-acetyltransferase
VLEAIPVVNINVTQRKRFDCGIHDLNDFFKRYSEPNHLKGLGKTFALLIDDEVVGYYTVSMGNTLEFIHVANENIPPLPRYPIPIALLARLAVSKHKQGKGWGRWLLIDAIHRISNAAKDVGAYAVVVDAKDEKAKYFYMQYGFLPFPNKPKSLYMSLESTADLIKEKIMTRQMS